MEMYGLLEDDLVAYLSATFNVTFSKANLNTLFESCKQLFVIRHLREKYCVGASLPSSAEIVNYEEGTITIAIDAYLERCTQVNGYDPRWDKVISEYKDVLKTLGDEKRDYMNIHDLGAILAKIVRAIKRRAASVDSLFVEKHCVYVVISRALYSDSMFKSIETRLAA